MTNSHSTRIHVNFNINMHLLTMYMYDTYVYVSNSFAVLLKMKIEGTLACGQYTGLMCVCVV